MTAQKSRGIEIYQYFAISAPAEAMAGIFFFLEAGCGYS